MAMALSLPLMLIVAVPPHLDRYHRHGLLPTEDVSFANIELPVNTPYVIKSDRFDDGISSASPYTSSDPSFPQYNDWIPIENDQDRKRHIVHVLSDEISSTPTVPKYGHKWCGVGGTGKGVRDGIPCVFPFTYRQKKYYSCTEDEGPEEGGGNVGNAWCATAVTQIVSSTTGKKVDTLLEQFQGGQWGFCEPCSIYQNRDFRQYTQGDEVRRQWEVNAVGGWGVGVEVADHDWNGTWVGDKTWDNVNFGRGSHATFVVQAAEKWNPTNVMIVKGGKYSINVPERMQLDIEQRWNDTRISVDANGYTSHYDAISKCYVALGQCRSYLRHPRRVPKANWMKLICGIGNFFTQLRPVAHNLDKYMRLREEEFGPTLFEVGNDLKFTARHTGELVCFANDAEGLYWNNKDNLTVTIECDGPCKKVSDCDNNPGCIDNRPKEPEPPQLCFNKSYAFQIGGGIGRGYNGEGAFAGDGDDASKMEQLQTETLEERLLRLQGERKLVEWAESRTLDHYYNDSNDNPMHTADTMAVHADAHLNICCNISSPVSLDDSPYVQDGLAMLSTPILLTGATDCIMLNTTEYAPQTFSSLRANFPYEAKVCCKVEDAGVTVRYDDPTGYRVGMSVALGGPAYTDPETLYHDSAALNALMSALNRTIAIEMAGLSHWGTNNPQYAYSNTTFSDGINQLVDDMPMVSSIHVGGLNASVGVFVNETTGATPRALIVDFYVRVSHGSTALALTQAMLAVQAKLAAAAAPDASNAEQAYATGFEDFLFDEMEEKFEGMASLDGAQRFNRDKPISMLPVQLLGQPFIFLVDEQRGVNITGAGTDNLFALTQGQSRTYTVALASAPLHPVTLSMYIRASNATTGAVVVDDDGMTVSPRSIVFTADNYSAPQPVTVQVDIGAVVEYDYEVLHETDSIDSRYAKMPPPTYKQGPALPTVVSVAAIQFFVPPTSAPTNIPTEYVTYSR
jgi:hypothetical protein